jgi:hypothetical protein
MALTFRRFSSVERLAKSITTPKTSLQRASYARTGIWIARFLKKCDTRCEEENGDPGFGQSGG